MAGRREFAKKQRWTRGAVHMWGEPDCELVRLGLTQVSRHVVHGGSVASHMCHAAKVSHKGVILTAVACSDFSLTRKVARSSGRAALAIIRFEP